MKILAPLRTTVSGLALFNQSNCSGGICRFGNVNKLSAIVMIDSLWGPKPPYHVVIRSSLRSLFSRRFLFNFQTEKRKKKNDIVFCTYASFRPTFAIITELALDAKVPVFVFETLTPVLLLLRSSPLPIITTDCKKKKEEKKSFKRERGEVGGKGYILATEKS